jgi:HD-like signal output (HDOD) protein
MLTLLCLTISAVALIILLCVAFSLRTKGGSSITSSNRREKPLRKTEMRDRREGHTIDSPSPMEDVIPDAAGILATEHDRLEQVKESTTHIREGIECVFSGEPGTVSKDRRPFAVEDIRPEVMEVVTGSITELNDFGAMYNTYRVLDDPNISMSHISKIVVTDPVLSAKILKVANSAYFGLQKKVDSIFFAILILGLNNLKNILYHELFKMTDVKSPIKGYLFQSLWKHVTLTSICASYISHLFDGLNKGTLFTMGLLHDIGKFVIPNLPKSGQTEQDSKMPSDAKFSIHDEDELFGVNHAIIGRLACEQWGLPKLIAKTIEMHHAPSFMEIDAIGLDEEYLKHLLALFVADQLAKIFANGESGDLSVVPLAHSYHTMVDRKRLEDLFVDSALLSEIKKAKVLMDGYL